MAHAQKPDFVFRQKGRVHMTRRGWHFSRLLADEVCGSVGSVCTVMERLCSAVVLGCWVPTPFSFCQLPTVDSFEQLNATVLGRLFWAKEIRMECPRPPTDQCPPDARLVLRHREKHSLCGPWGLQEAEAPRFQDNRRIKVVRLSALSTSRLCPSGNTPSTLFQ
jgi:hypothetical protein